ncbi:hypothetical protein MERGE_003014 [Pneumocystis wakefieldiae]|uniref:RNA polymerase Rpb4/RPC9 core domain-containing protein n=1 Tax=Pneumocystis wakefieldiae TaxID=38082 RepID=A0A899FVA3_9ASCO|nr:hypothetical protein MERGE_003014 [Pneumocystis wakefieldiae]
MPVAARRHRVRQRTRLEEEDASRLQLGEEFANATCLSVSEAKIILEAVLSQRQKELGEEIVMTDVIRKIKDYLNIFARFRTQESVHAAERVLRGDPDLHSFETAQLGTLCCEEAEEARTLVPSLSEKKSDEALQTLLDELSNLRPIVLHKRKSVKKAKLEEIHEIQENKRHFFESESQNISSSLFSVEEDELIGNNDLIFTKTFTNKKHGKKDLRKLIEISNKYETKHKVGNIPDEQFFKGKKKTIKNTSFSQESDQLENINIEECIEVELQEDEDKTMNNLDFWHDNIKVSDKEPDPIDMLSDDPLTSPFSNSYTLCTKKEDKKSSGLEHNKNSSKNFDVIINSNSTNYNNKNDSNLISSGLNDSFEGLFKEKINYEHEKKQDIIESKPIFNNFKSHILEKLTGRKYVPIIGLDSEYTKLRELLYRTINSGESNTCLIIGPKSSGKSNIIDTAINSLNEFSSYFFVVRLNGIIQTDDRLALKEIARQLNVSMNLDDKENITSGFSDNLFKILAILSHPKELDLVNDNKTSGEFDSSYNPLSTNNITFVSVIFILDNFDLFTRHHRQTLLYNLFDISQTKKAPIAVIGLTRSLDSVESLEKRVKSRFSHRIIQIKHPDNLDLFTKICRSGLTIDCEPPAEISLKEKEREFQFIKSWNKQIDNMFQEGNPIYQLVKKLFMTSKDVRIFYSHCIIPIISLLSPSSNSQEKLFFSGVFFNSCNKITQLNGISLLQLSLLICAARIDTRDVNTFNFNMVYKEYYELVTKTTSSSTLSVIKNTSIRLWERDILLDAWEKLCNFNFLQPCNTALTNIGGLDRECRMYRVEIVLMDLISYMEKVKTIPTILKRWTKDVVA